MDFKNAVKALQIGKKEGKKFRLSTEFGKNPEEELPFPEYPRPQMRRENWTNLNGWWEYAFTETQKMPKCQNSGTEKFSFRFPRSAMRPA